MVARKIIKNYERFTSEFTSEYKLVKLFFMIFGRKIKELRDEQGVLQRQLAAFLEIDTPMFSKIERGDRKAKREQVIKMAEYFHQDVNEMLTLWLADKVLETVKNEDAINLAAIKIAKEEIKAKNT